MRPRYARRGNRNRLGRDTHEIVARPLHQAGLFKAAIENQEQAFNTYKRLLPGPHLDRRIPSTMGCLARTHGMMGNHDAAMASPASPASPAAAAAATRRSCFRSNLPHVLRVVMRGPGGRVVEPVQLAGVAVRQMLGGGRAGARST